jgi:hypothetical protein
MAPDVLRILRCVPKIKECVICLQSAIRKQDNNESQSKQMDGF